MSAGNTAIVYGPFLAMIFSIGFALLGLLILYLIIRAAINNSKLNQNVEMLRSELRELNNQVRLLKASSEKDESQ